MMEKSIQDLILEREGFQPLPGVLAPSGVYLLLAKGVVLYVGQSINVHQRLSAHYNAKQRGYRKKLFIGQREYGAGDTRALSIPYDQVLVKWLPKPELDRVEIQLINRYKPKFNIDVRGPLPQVRIDLADIMMAVEWKRKASNQSSQELKRRRL